MKILLITTGLELGGAERQVVDLANRLAARGHQVALAYLIGGAQVLPCSDVAVFPLKWSKSVLGVAKGLARLRKLIRAWRPDVVHSHMVHANLVTRLVRLITPMRRLICTAHNKTEGGWWVTVAYRITDRLASLSTNVSAEAVAAFEKAGAAPKGRMVAVLNGIDLEVFSNRPECRRRSRQALFPHPGQHLLLSVGRLHPQKNHAALLRVFAELSRVFPSAVLWIAGDGLLKDVLRRQATALKLDDKVIFLGARTDVPALMQAADLFVLSSSFEGFGLVVAEAMACGLPVVATDAGGVAEVMNGTGFLVPVGDEKAMGRAMIRALTMSESERETMVRDARRQVESRLTMERCVDIWLNLYSGRMHVC